MHKFLYRDSIMATKVISFQNLAIFGTLQERVSFYEVTVVRALFFVIYLWGKSRRKREEGKTPLQISRRKDQAGSLGTAEKTLRPSEIFLGYIQCKQ